MYLHPADFSDGDFTIDIFRKVAFILQILTKTIYIKGTVAPDFVGSFLTCIDRSGQEKEPLLVFNIFCHSLDFWQTFYSFKGFHSKTSRRFLESPRWIYKCGQRFSEIFAELLTMFKFFLEMNLQFINIIGDTLTNLADFYPIFQSVSNKRLQFVELPYLQEL